MPNIKVTNFIPVFEKQIGVKLTQSKIDNKKNVFLKSL